MGDVEYLNVIIKLLLVLNCVLNVPRPIGLLQIVRTTSPSTMFRNTLWRVAFAN